MSFRNSIILVTMILGAFFLSGCERTHEVTDTKKQSMNSTNTKYIFSYDRLPEDVVLLGEEAFAKKYQPAAEILKENYNDQMIAFLPSVSQENKVLVLLKGETCNGTGSATTCETYEYSMYDVSTKKEDVLGNSRFRIPPLQNPNKALTLFDSLHHRIIQLSQGGFELVTSYYITLYDVESLFVFSDEITPHTFDYPKKIGRWAATYDYTANKIAFSDGTGGVYEITLDVAKSDLGVGEKYVGGEKCPFLLSDTRGGDSQHYFKVIDGDRIVCSEGRIVSIIKKCPFVSDGLSSKGRPGYRNYSIGDFDTFQGILCRNGMVVEGVTVDEPTLRELEERGIWTDKNNYYVGKIVRDGDPSTWQRINSIRSKDSKRIYFYHIPIKELNVDKVVINRGLLHDDKNLIGYSEAVFGDDVVFYLGQIDEEEYTYLGPAHWKHGNAVFTIGSGNRRNVGSIYSSGVLSPIPTTIDVNLDATTTKAEGYYVYDHNTLYAYQFLDMLYYTGAVEGVSLSGLVIIGSFYYLPEEGRLGIGSETYSGTFTLIKEQGNTAIFKDTTGRRYIAQSGPEFRYSGLFEIQDIDSESFHVTQITKHQEMHGFKGETIVIGGSDKNGEYLFVIPEGHNALGNILLYVLMIEDTDQQDVFFERDEEKTHYHAYINGIQVSHRYVQSRRKDKQDPDVLSGFVILPFVEPQ